ncbi:hypothetical protein [Enterococcus sp. DIV1420a]|uniref:hypothetical protein n=1 Tax=Enterococcus sp. DIV1420a TaxID=2774672 RepID=UPI003F29E99B
MPDYYNEKHYPSPTQFEAEKRIEQGNYWYIALDEIHLDSARIKSIQRLTNVTIVEFGTEATPAEIDRYKLVYCGHGRWKDRHVQKHLRKYVKG